MTKVNPETHPSASLGAAGFLVPDDLVKAFERDGFIIHDFAFDPALIEACALATKAMAGQSIRVQNLWRKNKAVKSLGAHPDVLAFLEGLYGRSAFPFQTLNFLVGTQQATHADTIHFDSEPPHFMCGVWVALEDITPSNGPLFYFPGSHNRPVASLSDIQANADVNKLDNIGDNIVAYFAKAETQFSRKTAVMKKGEAVIWAANVLHGGSPVKDPMSTRLSQVTHYYFDGCNYTAPINTALGGKRHLRHPYDFARGRFVWGEKDGKRIWPGLRNFAAERINTWLKRTPRFK